MREGEIVLYLVVIREKCEDYFAKMSACAGFPRRETSPRGSAPRGPHHGPLRARTRCVAWAAHVGHAREYVFLFHEELEIVF